ncbi:MAG: hypothetical protein P0Y55_08360 [Candidatus Cohnella colombiensis]|uniref:DinB family protein n=1 Tax=Candidatus Cohnella colombiensis TaxID=3121368 RepID=A0AA95JD82_9BACL|nr:MAG: hypothetical protein P0Y55_08360 [Cohnella sp.]
MREEKVIILKQEQFIKTFLKISLHRIYNLYFAKFKISLTSIGKEQLWKSENNSNSIGGIILHLCEHIRMSELNLKRRDDKFRDDFVIYFPIEDLKPMELIERFELQINDWRQSIIPYINDEIRLSEEDVHDLYNLVEHMSYHLGQVIDKIQSMTGIKFNFYENGLNERYLRDQIESNVEKD